MSLKIKAIDAENREVALHITSAPNFCPLCYRDQVSVFVTAFKPTYDTCQIVYRCTNKDCQSFYIAYYREDIKEYKTIHEEYKLITTRPQNIKELIFEKEIRKLSPNFCEIFQEAIFAEMRNYKQIAGVGYRKSLEFLVKDFCIKKHPTKKQEIKKAWLMSCIKNYISDLTIQRCAELATWLGNDETHYIRMWKNKDIDDLKALIQLTKNWMLTNIQTDKYVRSMKP
jgi:hypothetical protein